MITKYKIQLISLYSLFTYSDDLVEKLKMMKFKEWYYEEALLFFQQSIESIGIALSFLPYSPIQSQYKVFSLPTLTSIGRTVIDNLFTISYLLEDKNTEEASLQKLVWEYHIDSERLELLKTYKSKNPIIKTLEQRIKKRKEDIQKHPLYNSLEPNEKNNCLMGTSDKIYSKHKIVTNLKINEDIL